MIEDKPGWLVRMATHCVGPFRGSVTRALQKIQQRHGSVVIAYIDDIVISTETIQCHLVMIKEMFECLRETGVRMRAEKCDFMRTETKYLRRVIPSVGIKSDQESVGKIRDWIPTGRRRNC